MHFTTLVMRNILRRPTRSALTVTGVAVAVAAVVALVGIAQTFQTSLLGMYQSRGVDLIVVRSGGVQRMSSSLRESLLPDMQALPGVEKASPGLAEAVSFENAGPMGVLIRGMPHDSLMLRDIELVGKEGRLLRPDDERVVLLGKRLAEDLGKKVGDRMEVVEDEDFEVIGIYQTYSPLENGSIIMPLAQLQWMMDREGEVTAFLVKAEHSDKKAVMQLARDIEALAPHIDAIPAREFVDTAT
ncbi:MAG: ABC transporter permease, partial [Candidatus Nealsonbacteria bacterium]|nr:ABC transporter permease [Candidatus Nealsonbacteria bacterium]